MEKKDKQRIETVLKEAESAAQEMSALLHNVESSTVEATRILKQLKVSAEAKEFLDGKRALNPEEVSKKAKIDKALEKEFGSTQEAEQVIKSSEEMLKRMHLDELSDERKRKIVI